MTEEGRLWAIPNEYAAGGMLWMNDAIDVLSRELHPLLGTIRRERVADLPMPHEHTPGNEALASPLFRGIEVSHGWVVTLSHVLTFDVDTFLGQVFVIADEIGSQITRGMLEHISQICDESGQTINAEGRDIFDVMIEILGTIDIAFDEEGNHSLQLVVHPDMAKKLADKQPTPEQVNRLRVVMERRKEEWDASRRRRELP